MHIMLVLPVSRSKGFVLLADIEVGDSGNPTVHPVRMQQRWDLNPGILIPQVVNLQPIRDSGSWW